jgi:hypothetical protein
VIDSRQSPVATRPRIRSVAMPSEHGGWGLTLEPCLLGLAVAPSPAGACLAAAAMTAFVARTPLKVVLVDRHRGRSLPRTVLARRVAGLELVVLLALVSAAVLMAEASFWVPAAIAAPLVVVELWFDVRSRSRRLVPELAGAIGVCAVTSMIVLADGDSARLSAALWAVLGARVLTSIPYVRAQIARLHGRPATPGTEVVADCTAITVAAMAVLLDQGVLAGAIAVVVVVVVQRLMARGPVPRAVVLGIRQMALGFGVVAATALGVLTT